MWSQEYEDEQSGELIILAQTTTDRGQGPACLAVSEF